MSATDLNAAAEVIELASGAVSNAVRTLATVGSVDEDQVVAYDLAHAASAVEAARSLLDYGAKGELEARITCAFVADATAELNAKLWSRESEWGVAPGALDGARDFVSTYRSPHFLRDLAFEEGPRHLDPDFELVQDTFRRFANDKIAPAAEHIHRANTDIPEEIIGGLGEIGAFGLSIPEQYGGYATGGESDYAAMIIATEELSRASLGAGGSLITRPEILARALEQGGTEDQKHKWLPQLATGEKMVAVSVTEPDYGSDVANIKVTAKPTEGGWLINGVKTWCTFAGRADVLMLLARSDADRSKTHRGLSLFIVEKPRAAGHDFAFTQQAGDSGAPGGGTMEGRSIDTIGYRGMHSYELALDDWFVPADNQIGGEQGLGKGFYFQMAGFENGRLQTAARSVGVMQAAYEAARQYASDRVVFGQTVGQYQLTQVKLARMAILIQSSRQFAYSVGRLLSKGEGLVEASMAKAYASRSAEWVAREALQIHGGMGYAEEYPVSRYYVDARVLSIFEGADETLALKIITRRLLDNANA